MDAVQGIHTDKCRLCLRRPSRDDIFFEINETTGNRFQTLTSLQLIPNPLLSSIVCESCDDNLAKFDAFREELIKKQAAILRLLHESEEIKDPVVEDDELESIIEYINEEHFEDEALEECQEIMFESNQIEFTKTDNESSSNSNDTKMLLRPKAWEWTDAMEADLVRYFRRYKTDKTTESYAFGKICKKFEAKGYPNISAKSIKYKYDKLVRDSEKLASIEQRAVEDDDSDEEPDQEERVVKKKRDYSSKTHWTESMEVALVFLTFQARREQPAISENHLHRFVSNRFQQAGFSNIYDHSICYHLKKLKRENPDRLLYLEEKARQLKEPFPGIDCSHQEVQTLSNKRRYLHWTEDMKQALVMHRDRVTNGTPSSLVWTTVASQMESDGYGTFTPKNVMHKYFNIKRQKMTCKTEVE